jgi:hypothetical protein
MVRSSSVVRTPMRPLRTNQIIDQSSGLPQNIPARMSSETSRILQEELKLVPSF